MPPAGLKLLHPLRPPTYPTTQHFGENPQWYPLTHGHNGIDFGIPLRTAVYATLPGTVMRVAGDNSGYGNHIRISHANNLLSLYGHFDERNWALIHEGDTVQAGQQIGYSGNTGHSSGPHLHFEVREGTTAFNPEPFLVTSLDVVVTDETEEEVDEVGHAHPGEFTETPLFKIRITAEPTLNIRTGPSIVYPAIGSFATGEQTDVFELGGNEIWVRTSKGFVAFRYNGQNLVEIVQD